ncbi:MAG: farnesyl-diphosphate synthase [Rhodobacteraceae bacterium]|nr:MAG: farnesyl-diphosphate synthase [Paracoccaceae bacterium]
MSVRFQKELTNAAEFIESRLNGFLPASNTSLMADPMRHAVMGGGKRLRAFLVLESANLFDINPEQAAYSAAAIECIHAYSLVHDDLPCMDDDDLRRGKPTVHVKWDEATAVLAGDGLQTLAFDILARTPAAMNDAVRVQLISSLAIASGRMVLGQSQDIAAETARVPLGLEAIVELQSNKTGALIEWSACAGAVLACQDMTALSAYAKALGLAFQIQDDILDIEGDVADTGKRLQKDTEAGKATFVSILGLDGAKQKARSLVEQACDVLSIYATKAESLRDAAQFVIERNK